MQRERTPLHDLFEEWGAEFLCEDGLERPLRLDGAGPEYEAARTATALADGGDRAWVELHGEDATDFLQRTLSSDLGKLLEGQGQWSAMLDGKGRWIVDLLLYRLPDRVSESGAVPRYGLDLPAVRRETFLQRLEMLHFSERIQWQTREVARLMVLGPQAAASVQALGLQPPLDFAVQVAATDGAGDADTEELLLLGRPDRGAECIEILGDAQGVLAHARALNAAGAVPCGLVALDILRVEAFLPRFGQDFSEADTLPGTSEWRRASLSKGCYAGQEVVAKIHTYGEAPRQLCRLRFDGPPQPLVGATLHDEEGKELGEVRSWVWSPQEDRGVGMGMLRRRAAKDGRRLTARLAEQEVPTVVEVPEKVVG